MHWSELPLKPEKQARGALSACRFAGVTFSLQVTAHKAGQVNGPTVAAPEPECGRPSPHRIVQSQFPCVQSCDFLRPVGKDRQQGFHHRKRQVVSGHSTSSGRFPSRIMSRVPRPPNSTSPGRMPQPEHLFVCFCGKRFGTQI
jgi:hypothetical protein